MTIRGTSRDRGHQESSKSLNQPKMSSNKKIHHNSVTGEVKEEVCTTMVATTKA